MDSEWLILMESFARQWSSIILEMEGRGLQTFLSVSVKDSESSTMAFTYLVLRKRMQNNEKLEVVACPNLS